MFELIRKKLETTKSVERSTYLWNSVNASLSACQSAFILMALTRTNGVYDAGVFSISFAVASLMLFVGQYGVRRYQSSDIKEKYTFSEYLMLRIFTCMVMLLASLLYCIYGLCFNGYTMDKFMVIFLFCILKCIQAYADVIHGRMQQKGRLDVAAKASTVRVVSETIVIIAALIVTKNLLLSTVLCIIASLLVLLLTSVNAAKDYCSLKPEIISLKWKRLKTLTVECFPLFVSLFLNMYISNAPKYAIDACLSEEIQTYYNILFMPAFAIGLLANFIFNPILTTYAEVWISGQIRKFKKLIIRQTAVIIGIMLLGLAVAFTIGVPLLSIIFGVDLTGYKAELAVVVIGGGMLAYTTFFSTVITIVRRQHMLLVAYVLVALLAKLLSGYFVTAYGVMGAVVMYSILMGALAVFFAIVIVVCVRKGTLKNR